MLSILNNSTANRTVRTLGRTYTTLQDSVGRLASGQRVRTAKDDPAALAIRELLRSDVATHGQARRNALDAISMIDVAEGACQQIADNLVRMNQLAHQAATDTYSDDQKLLMRDEFENLVSEITRVAESVEFNGNQLLSGSGSTPQIHLGSNETEDLVPVEAMDLRAEALGLGNPIYRKASSVAMGDPLIATNSEEGNYLEAVGGSFDSLLEVRVRDVDTDAVLESYSVAFAPNQVRSLEQVVSAINLDAGADVASAFEVIDNKWTLKIDAQTAGKNYVDVNGTYKLRWMQAGWLVDADFHRTDGDPTKWLDLADGTTTARDAIDQAIEKVADYRAKLGAAKNRLEHASDVLAVEAQSKLASESRISDVDVATEMGRMTRQQVLAQAGTSLLSQANAIPEMALRLLSS